MPGPETSESMPHSVQIPKSEAPTDGALFQLARNGDRVAFGELVDRHKDSLVNYLTRAAGSRDRAEDLAQDAFLRLYERGQGYVEQGKLRAYLFRIATNLLRSQCRRERRWEILRTVFPPVNGYRPDRSPQMRLLSRELEQQVEAALLRVPLRFRAPLVLSQIEGWPLREIAELLGVKEGTVKSRVHRGKKILREHLAPYWQESER